MGCRTHIWAGFPSVFFKMDNECAQKRRMCVAGGGASQPNPSGNNRVLWHERKTDAAKIDEGLDCLPPLGRWRAMSINAQAQRETKEHERASPTGDNGRQTGDSRETVGRQSGDTSLSKPSWTLKTWEKTPQPKLEHRFFLKKNQNSFLKTPLQRNYCLPLLFGRGPTVSR